MTIPTRIIFLDFDGVILTLRTTLASNNPGFSSARPDPLACAVIERICKTGIHIVVSSTWRETPRWQTKLDQAGLIDFIHPAEPITPINDSSRSNQIIDWLKKHPEVTDYQIIDDDDHNWTPEQKDRWIICNAHDGLSGTQMVHLLDWAGLSGSNRSEWPQVQSRLLMPPPNDSEL